MPTIQEDLALSVLSYLDTTELNNSDLWNEMASRGGWEHLGHSDDFFRGSSPDGSTPNNGFEAQVFRSPEGEVVIAYTGTNSFDDIDDDIAVVLHGDAGQRDSAIILANLVVREEGIDTLHVTGHSLGGISRPGSNK